MPAQLAEINDASEPAINWKPRRSESGPRDAGSVRPHATTLFDVSAPWKARNQCPCHKAPGNVRCAV